MARDRQHNLCGLTQRTAYTPGEEGFMEVTETVATLLEE